MVAERADAFTARFYDHLFVDPMRVRRSSSTAST